VKVYVVMSVRGGVRESHDGSTRYERFSALEDAIEAAKEHDMEVGPKHGTQVEELDTGEVIWDSEEATRTRNEGVGP